VDVLLARKGLSRACLATCFENMFYVFKTTNHVSPLFSVLENNFKEKTIENRFLFLFSKTIFKNKNKNRFAKLKPRNFLPHKSLEILGS
jgi:hypothetical protein